MGGARRTEAHLSGHEPEARARVQERPGAGSGGEQVSAYLAYKKTHPPGTLPQDCA